jgi:hypothetical protein
LTGAGLLLLGYYVGREIGRSESVRKELQEARAADDDTNKLLEKKAGSRPRAKRKSKLKTQSEL